MREFAKRKRANSWQSKGKFVFKFIDCHAIFAKTARKGEFKMISVQTNSLIHFTMQANLLIKFHYANKFTHKIHYASKSTHKFHYKSV